MHQVLRLINMILDLTKTYSFIGNVYIADTGNNRIRKVTISTGIITTIVGTGTASYSGDNGAATSATINNPLEAVLDASGTILCHNITQLLTFPFTVLLPLGNMYIADTYNHRIRKVTVLTDIITTIAGTGTGSYSGDNGAATSATLNYPEGVALDSSGFSFYIFSFLYCYIHAHHRQRVHR